MNFGAGRTVLGPAEWATTVANKYTGRDQGASLAVFMIHGNGVDHRILKPLGAELESTGWYRPHYVDLPGFGGSPALVDPAGLPEIADWLEQRIRSLAAGEPFALLGNSLGGLLCQEMADRFSDDVQGIFLLATVVYPQAEARTLPQHEVHVQDSTLLDSLPEPVARMFCEYAVIRSEATWNDFAQWVLPGLNSASLRAMAKLAKRYYLDPLPADRQTQLLVPVAIVCGRQDNVTGYVDQAKLLHRYPAAQMSVVESAGHNVHIDQPEAVRGHLRAWAEDVHCFFSVGETE